MDENPWPSQDFDPEIHELDEYGNTTMREPDHGWEEEERQMNDEAARYFAQQQWEARRDDLYGAIHQPLGQNLAMLSEHRKIIKGLSPASVAFEQGDIDELKPFLTEARPFSAPPLGATLEEKFDWAREALQRLEADGYNVTIVGNALVETYNAIAHATGTVPPEAYAQFAGYVFQVEQHVRSWSKYKLINTEPATSTYRRADETRVSAAHKIIDYKAYASGADSPPLRQSCDAQIRNYAADSAGWQPGTILIICFKNGAPPWYKTMLRDHAALFAAGTTVKIKSATQHGSTPMIVNSAYVGPPILTQPTISSFFAKK